MSRRKLIVAITGAACAALLPASALADTCANISRAPAPCGMSCTAPVVEGNWVWLPSIGVPEPVWGFAPPGTIDSQQFNFPGANGNYQQDRGQEGSLLNRSAICQGGGQADLNRQTSHGIQSGCGGAP